MQMANTRLAALIAGLGTLLVPSPVGAAQPLASVRSIQGGLTVRPPSRQPVSGTVTQKLYDSYFLRTQVRQKASLGFFDRSVLHMNERTGLVLQSVHIAVVRQGEVEVNEVQGTRHTVHTANAVATALGTDFDVRIERAPSPSVYPSGGNPAPLPPGTTTVSVVTGTVIVANRFGSRRVHANQWTHVRPGKAPSPPTTHNARADIAWAQGLP